MGLDRLEKKLTTDRIPRMIRIEENISLQPFNTFGVAAVAEKLAVLTTTGHLDELFKSGLNEEIKLILGGGSNILLVNDIPGLTLINRVAGISIAEENEETVLVEALGGAVWHDLVKWSLENDFGGIENLSLIPGSVGAAPIQNIGAYGVELQMVFESLEAVEIKTGRLKVFSKEDCRFGYRHSIFKNFARNQFFIHKIFLRLTKGKHRLHLDYGAIRQMLDQRGVKDPTIQDIGAAVVAIRQSKLPDPSVLGNAGSFFKNPEISQAEFEDLQVRFPHIVHFPGSSGGIKLSAGWLIEQCGWKGRREGNVGCFEKQALVLVNFGTGRGADVIQLADRISMDVYTRFGIELKPEINVL